MPATLQVDRFELTVSKTPTGYSALVVASFVGQGLTGRWGERGDSPDQAIGRVRTAILRDAEVAGIGRASPLQVQAQAVRAWWIREVSFPRLR